MKAVDRKYLFQVCVQFESDDQSENKKINEDRFSQKKKQKLSGSHPIFSMFRTENVSFFKGQSSIRLLLLGCYSEIPPINPSARVLGRIGPKFEGIVSTPKHTIRYRITATKAQPKHTQKTIIHRLTYQDEDDAKANPVDQQMGHTRRIGNTPQSSLFFTFLFNCS